MWLEVDNCGSLLASFLEREFFGEPEEIRVPSHLQFVEDWRRNASRVSAHEKALL
jgi:hypothetical protein